MPKKRNDLTSGEASGVTEAPMPRSHRRSVDYVDKSRTFYAAHGYTEPYRWASHSTVPFTPWSAVGRSVAEATVAVITTAFPIAAAAGVEREPKRATALRSSPVPHEMFTADLSWDKEATHTNDVNSFMPLASLKRLSGGAIGEVANRFYCVPTEYSQRRTAADSAQILEWCREDGVHAVLLVAL